MNHELILTGHRDKAIEKISERLNLLMKHDAELCDMLAIDRESDEVDLTSELIHLYHECVELVALHDSILPALERDASEGR